MICITGRPDNLHDLETNWFDEELSFSLARKKFFFDKNSLAYRKKRPKIGIIGRDETFFQF
jgi:hypothetical protein